MHTNAQLNSQKKYSKGRMRVEKKNCPGTSESDAIMDALENKYANMLRTKKKPNLGRIKEAGKKYNRMNRRKLRKYKKKSTKTE